MKWTPQQAKAIELRNKNILVAAAAGSGKTAVLVERIKRLILEDRCSIDRMLIVTFTNAAASEMKEKIEKAIKSSINEISEKLSASENNSQKLMEDLIYLKKQLDLLPESNISTFHAFAMEVIRRYFYIIDIEPNFKICDDAQQLILMEDGLDKLLEELYEENSKDFYDFLNCYSGDRSDESFRNMILETFKKLQSLPYPFQWLSDSVESLDCSEEEFAAGKTMEYIWKESENLMEKSLNAAKRTMEYGQAVSHPGAVQIAAFDMDLANDILKMIKGRNYDGIVKRLAGHRYVRLTDKYLNPKGTGLSPADTGQGEKVIRDGRQVIKESTEVLKKELFLGTFKDEWENVRATYSSAKFLEKCLIRYDEIFRDLKAKKGLLDFSDIEHYALSILQDQEAANFYREKFQHIFIDEYQDSNIIQEELIKTIKRENNLFMVGDVKQSIYKFRLAEPEIFQGKYRAFEKSMEELGEKSLSEKIDLNKNFRSKEPVIQFINQIFRDTMADYDDNAALYLGDAHGSDCPHIPKLYLAEIGEEGKEKGKINDEEDGSDGAENASHDAENDSDDPEDELMQLIKTEKEALAAVKIIRDNLGKTIFDSKKGIERPLQLRDIVILLRVTKNYGDIFYKILSDNNIPAFVDDNEGFFDTIEVNVFMDLLSLLDNPKQDLPLLSVLRSEIFGFTMRELVDIRLNMKEGDFCSCFIACAEGRRGSNAAENYVLDPKLCEKCKKTAETIKRWQNLGKVLPLDEFVWKLMLESGFYLAMGAMPSGRQRQANLRALVDKSKDYTNGKEGSLYGFVSYIEAVKQRKVSTSQVKMVGEDEDTVRIMTVHKSKGLEFPMVIAAGYCKEFKYTSIGRGLGVHKDLGIAFPVVNYKESWYKAGLMQNAIKRKILQEEEEEEKRILYVALTRAKDMLYLLGIVDDFDKSIEKLAAETPKKTSFLSMTGKNICVEMNGCIKIENSDLLSVSKRRKRSVARVMNMMEDVGNSVDGAGLTISGDVDSKMKFTYPNVKQLTTKSKYSVSELNQHRTAQTTLVEPASFKVREKLTPAQVGTVTHKILEKIDFGATVDMERETASAYIRDLIHSMIPEEYITAEEAESVKADKLIDFVLGPLGKRIGRSHQVTKERPFNIKWEVEGSKAIVQGIIDCYFEEDDQLVLIDYKTSNINSEKDFEIKKNVIAETYRTQMDIYRCALERATGKKVKEAYLYLTNVGKTIEM